MAAQKARIKREREREKWEKNGMQWDENGGWEYCHRSRELVPGVRARGRSRSSRKGEPMGAENTLRDTGWPFFTLRSALHPRPPPIPQESRTLLQLTFPTVCYVRFFLFLFYLGSFYTQFVSKKFLIICK